jgi:hypothetical protein
MPASAASEMLSCRKTAMLDQRRARIASAVVDVEHARREDAVPQCGNAKRRQWRLVIRFHDQRVAGGKRRAALAGDEQQRMIERPDSRDVTLLIVAFAVMRSAHCCCRSIGVCIVKREARMRPSGFAKRLGLGRKPRVE